jgi:hypothetical protein
LPGRVKHSSSAAAGAAACGGATLKKSAIGFEDAVEVGKDARRTIAPKENRK